MLFDATRPLARTGFVFSSTSGVHILLHQGMMNHVFSEVSEFYSPPACGFMDRAWFEWSSEIERGTFAHSRWMNFFPQKLYLDDRMIRRVWSLAYWRLMGNRINELRFYNDRAIFLGVIPFCNDWMQTIEDIDCDLENTYLYWLEAQLIQYKLNISQASPKHSPRHNDT